MARRRFEDLPSRYFVPLIAVGLALWFSDLWIDETTAVHTVVGGIGLVIAIYSWLLVWKHRRLGPPR